MAYTTTKGGLLRCSMATDALGTQPSAATDGIDLAGADESLPGCAVMESFRLSVTAAAGNLAADTALAMMSRDKGATWVPYPAANKAITGGSASEELGDLKLNAAAPGTRIAYYLAAQAATFYLDGVPRLPGQ